MEFRTYIDIPVSDVEIDHSVDTMLFGSCFSTHMGLKLQQHKFRVNANPFGILYNPFSISNAIRRILSTRGFTEEDLVHHQGLYHSFMHHSEFSSPDKQVCLDNISARFDAAVRAIQETDRFLITFGTAYVYWRMESGEITANCHKFPESEFHRARLSVDDIVEEWSELIEELIERRPNTKLVFTISPVRHWKDGAHENQISKSILHLAIDILEKRFDEHVRYFPAYEVMMDELRDYRYYAEDMLHPSSLALRYIWDRFSSTFFSNQTRKINSEWDRIQKSLDHRALHPQNEQHQRFLKETFQKIESFSQANPTISCDEEIEELLSRMNQ